jgi:hypothetical protein
MGTYSELIAAGVDLQHIVKENHKAEAPGNEASEAAPSSVKSIAPVETIAFSTAGGTPTAPASDALQQTSSRDVVKSPISDKGVVSKSLAGATQVTPPLLPAGSKLVVAEDRDVGAVSCGTLASYIGSAGGCGMIVLVAVVLVVSTGSRQVRVCSGNSGGCVASSTVLARPKSLRSFY